MRAVVVAAALLVVAGCGSNGTEARAGQHTTPADPAAPRSITVTSPAFEDGAAIPSEFTCDGKGISPPIQWSGIDKHDVASITLVVDDPDAPGRDYIHWIVNGIATSFDGLEKGALPDDAFELEGSGGRGWKPPCPPSGKHHYRFTVLAFSSDAFSVRDTSSPDKLVAALMQHAVAWGRLTGTVTAK